MFYAGESLAEDASLLDSRYFAQTSVQTTPSIESRESLELSVASPPRQDHTDTLGTAQKHTPPARASKSDETFGGDVTSLRETNRTLVKENEELRRQLDHFRKFVE